MLRLPFQRFISLLTSYCVTYTMLVLVVAPFSTAHARVTAALGKTALTAQQRNAPHREGELLVKFRTGVTQGQRNALTASQGMRRKKQLRGDSGLEQFEILGGQDSREVALRLLESPEVEFAEPNFLVAKDQLAPADPRFEEQWALKNTGQNGGHYGSDVNATAAWQTTVGASTVVVAVIDSGIDFTHPDLSHNQWTNPSPAPEGDVHGWDYITNTGAITDEQGHGTSIAGIIAAEGNNAEGVSGVMWDASLMSLRVLDNTGTGDVANAVEAIDYAVAHGAQVANISWGTYGESLVLKDALGRAIRRGVVVVCSAGNNGLDLATAPYYPASFGIRDLIVVGASDKDDQLASWSNWGSSRVTVAAPGTNILTTKFGGGYWTVNGTSAAAPIVSGVAGLIKTIRPTENVHNVAKAIEKEARQVAGLSNKVSSGGVVDAEASLSPLRGSPNRPLPFAVPGYGSGGTGPGGSFSTNPPPRTTGAPVSGLPNLDHIRTMTPVQAKAKEPIQSNVVCADCDPLSGGGGGQNHPAGDLGFSTARRRPGNETGQPGVDLGSRNFNWSLPLLNLPGRSGMDLNLTLYYNSLVWTREFPYIKYNADLGSPAPGFRLAMPTLQQAFTDTEIQTASYMLVTPSGGRVSLRQVGTSSLFESQDGSYTQLDITNTAAPLIRLTDGTQMKFTAVSINSEHRCTEIKDRNGNYISATYNTTNGHLLTITDTLGRVITFVYNANNNLERIRQTWAGVSHDWATFSYGEVYVAPNFLSGWQVNGPNNNYVSVLTQVSLDDGTYFTFDYNAAFGQVNRINRYGADAQLRSYTSYNMNTSAGQNDCPRFTERRDWALNWNGNAEAVTTYSSASDNSWSQLTAPDGTIYKELFHTTGWQTGLTSQSEVWSGTIKKKWTTVSWTQDDTNLSYKKNPRPTETNVYDEAGNRRRVTISYYPTSIFSLPSDVYEYASDGTTLLRRSHTDYNLSSVYIDRRIIGLVSVQHAYDGANNLISKRDFHYDWASDYMVYQGQPVQHDGANYGISFIGGRGNLSLARQFDVNYPNDDSRAHVFGFRFNTAGSPLFQGDASWHGSTVGYADTFSDGVNRNTFAYPTTITDADGFVSRAQYNYDLGAITRTEDPKVAVFTMTYDAAGRLDRVTNQFSTGYTRYLYMGGGEVVSHSTIQNGAGEAMSVTYFDGAGRVRGEGGELPNSYGGYRGQFIFHDVMGRTSQVTNLAEINADWIPVGDDAAGWSSTYQTYDWKGRPLLTTNPDGSTSEASYGGCGCAGGEIATVRDERGRRRKFTKDVFGRLKQVDELNWDQTIYSTASYNYNARDQITGINQSGQTRAFTYDGYGRLGSKTTPEQGTTSYSYHNDDQLQTITDARGATVSFSYNSRHLVTGITYGMPAGVAATPNVSFGYDAAGNRTSMNDGLGSVTYNYNTLSQMTWETRTFTGVGSYTLNYAYNLSGELTSISNPWNAQVGYNYDKLGRPTGVSGSGYYGVSSYVNSIGHRAFGLKQMANANGRTLSLQYDNRMRVTQWNVPGVMGWNYSYNNFNENTGRVTYAQNLNDATLDRSYDYDHVGRLIEAHTGSEARGALIGQGGAQDGPYSHSYRYDQSGNMSYRVGWGGSHGSWREEWPSYTNNRMNGFGYDAAGNQTAGSAITYDATGQQIQAGTMSHAYDGDRLRGKRNDNGAVTYYLRSSVLGGQVVAELDGSGNWTRGYVYLGGQMLAIQSNGVNWVHQDPVTKSQKITNSSGAVTSTIDLDPWGGETSRSSNQAFQPQRYTTYTRDNDGGDDAMHRRYGAYWTRFSQPDPYDGSYSLGDPQSFNRYSYVQNDPVNFVDPSGLIAQPGSGDYFPDPATGAWEWVWWPTAGVTVGINWQGGFAGGVTDGSVFEQLPLITHGTGSRQTPGSRMTDGEIDRLLAELMALLTKECAAFIKGALQQLLVDTGRSQHGTTDILKLFEAVRNGKGFDWRTMTDAQAKGGGAPGQASISIDGNSQWANMSSASRGLILVHELFHVAGYSHRAMAQATYNMGERHDKSYKGWFGEFPNPNEAQFQGPNGAKLLDGTYSGFFKNILAQHCGK